MIQEKFEDFIANTLEIVGEFTDKNKLKLVYGLPNEENFPYIKNESPLNDELLYSIIGPSKGTFYLRFTKFDINKYQIFIDNSEISLTLDQDMKRLTTYPNDEFNQRIDSIKGDVNEKLTTCLYILWDISCFIIFLSKERKK